MTLDDVIKHIALLHHDGEIQSLCASIIDNQGRVQTIMHIPESVSLMAPTGVHLLYMSTINNLNATTTSGELKK